MDIKSKVLMSDTNDEVITVTELNQVYKCSLCGNIVEVVHASAGILVCCGKEMRLLKENTVDASREKHVPVIEKTNDEKIRVKIGSVPHPMEAAHYIEWVELLVDSSILRQNLKPGDKPEAEFCVCAPFNKLSAREYCNLHGLWKS